MHTQEVACREHLPPGDVEEETRAAPFTEVRGLNPRVPIVMIYDASCVHVYTNTSRVAIV
jgi:hypothetical protein